MFAFILSCALFSLPFFWFRNGEVDLGGDFSRLYLYAPWRYLQIFGLYSVVPEGVGRVTPNQYYIPYLLFLTGIQKIVGSQYIVVHLFNGLKLAAGFLSMYAIVKTMIGSRVTRLIAECASFLAAIFYIFSPSVIGNMNNALLSHDQVFLNPLLFYLMLRFMQRRKWIYIAGLLMLTVIFSGNFSWFSAPPLFAFYPIAGLFLFFYVRLVQKIRVPWILLGAGLLLYLGLHAFHYLPEIKSLLTPGSYTNQRFFDKDAIAHEGVIYFTGVLPLSKASLNFLFPSVSKPLAPLAIFVPLTLILGVYLRKTKNHDLPLVMSFFALIFFLVTANVTNIGVEVYKRLFYIPGFSMFRNFIGQWQFIFNFFTALYLAFAAEQIMLRLKKAGVMFIIVVAISIVAASVPFISGDLANPVRWGTKGVRTGMVMDPKYLEVLEYIHTLPSDGKLLMLPFSDWGAQVVHGLNKGAYVGPSTISYLAGKPDFSGYQMIAPFPEIFFRLTRENNYAALRDMFRLLNIRYIFHNNARDVYDDVFPEFPYTYARQSLPGTQAGMRGYIEKMGAKKIFSEKSYDIYELPDFLPLVFTPTAVTYYENSVDDWYGQTASFFIDDAPGLLRHVYIDRKNCEENNLAQCTPDTPIEFQSAPKVAITRINPTHYSIDLTDISAPFVLSFLQGYDVSWTAFISEHQRSDVSYDQEYLDGAVQEKSGSYATDRFFDPYLLESFWEKAIPSSQHVLVNGYANGWYVSDKEIQNRNSLTIHLLMRDQRYVFAGLAVSIASLFLLIASLVFGIMRHYFKFYRYGP